MYTQELLAPRGIQGSRNPESWNLSLSLDLPVLPDLRSLARSQDPLKMSDAAKFGVLPGRLEPGDIITPEQLAERLQVGVRWVYAVVERERNPLPALRCGRYIRIYWPDVCAWLRSRNA